MGDLVIRDRRIRPSTCLLLRLSARPQKHTLMFSSSARCLRGVSLTQGEPITFCEKSFADHGSSAMRNFLSMAVNLQLFKQVHTPRLFLYGCLLSV